MCWQSQLLPVLMGMGALVLVAPEQAAATQVHVPSEGLYVHQIAHLFFTLSMALLLFWLRQRDLVKERGWRLIQLAALFFIIWNVDAFVVHVLDDRSDLFRTIDAGTWHATVLFDSQLELLGIIYYVGKMDHLLCAPGMILLYCGLRSLLRDAQSKQAAAVGNETNTVPAPSQDACLPHVDHQELPS